MSQRNITLKEPSEPVDLLIIAGEHSGDEHAARLLKKISENEPDLKVYAVGGRHLVAAGAVQIFDLTLHSVIGIVEVLKNYGFFMELFKKLLVWIERVQPKNILFVDYPGFNLRLAEQLYKRKLSRKGGGDIGVFYYISPQVWAWKAKRRFKIAKWVDSLGTLFPFEIESYSDTNLDVSFVGHPFIDEEFKSPVVFDPEGPVLLLPGSRLGPVCRIFPVLMEAFETFAKKHPDARAAVIYPSVEVKELLEAMLADYASVRDRVVLEPNDKQVSGRAVLMSSGTISLICALAGLPGAIVYKLNTFSYLFGKVVVKVPFIGIENILLKRAIHPEFIQKVDVEALAQELIDSVSNAHRIQAASSAAEELKKILSPKSDQSVYEWLSTRLVR
ncbi:MAG: lipid-A-disaccharide synthase [Opitutales bacterium]